MPIKSFRYQTYLLFILSTTVPILIVAGFLSLFYNRRLREEYQLTAMNTLGIVESSIQNHLYELDRIGFTPYLYRDIQTFFTYMKNGFVLKPPSYVTIGPLENNYVLTMSKLMFTARQSIRSIIFYPDDDEGRYSYAIMRNTAGLQVINNGDYRQQDWYQDAQTSPAYIMLPPQISGAGREERYFTRVQMIVDLDSQKKLGVLRTDVSLDKLEEVLLSISPSPDAGLVLCDRDGEIQICNRGSTFAGSNISSYVSNSSFITIEKPMANTGWSLFYLAEIRTLRRIQLFTFILAFLLCGGVTFASLLIYRMESERTVHSVKNILGTLTAMQGGDFAVRSEVSSQNELALISQGVNSMGEKIKLYINREYIAVIERQNAEYRALQAQINPHFLYNTLNDLVALNRMNEREQLEKSIFQLRNMFRYSCTPVDTVTLSAELFFCEQYLLLRKQQLGDRLQYFVNIKEECRGWEIPKLILQPLVENAIVHGMDNTNAGGLTIRIEAKSIEDKSIEDKSIEGVEIVVEDDGNGFDPDSLAEDKGRVGIANVQKRLMAYSEGSGLEIVSSPGQGARFILSIFKKVGEPHL